MKDVINNWIEKYRYGIIYLEYKIRNKAQWIQMVESERSIRTEFQTQCSQSHLTNQRNHS